MANRYWVGGTGNWSDINHWSVTSGGSGGAVWYAGSHSTDTTNNDGWIFEDPTVSPFPSFKRS